MVTLGGFSHFREFPVVPGKLAGFNNDAADGSAVATDKLGRGMHNNIRAMVKWFAQKWGGKGVVHHQWNTGFMGDIGHRLNINDVVGGIADRFDIDDLCAISNGGVEMCRVIRVHKCRADTHAPEIDIEL